MRLGAGADTAWFGYSVMVGTGLPDGFDEVAWTVTVGPVSGSYAGKHLCIDSSYFPPSGLWLWAPTGQSEVPTWDGPHCFIVRD